MAHFARKQSQLGRIDLPVRKQSLSQLSRNELSIRFLQKQWRSRIELFI